MIIEQDETGKMRVIPTEGEGEGLTPEEDIDAELAGLVMAALMMGRVTDGIVESLRAFARRLAAAEAVCKALVPADSNP